MLGGALLVELALADCTVDSFGVLESLAVAGVTLSALLVVARPSVLQWVGLATLTTAVDEHTFGQVERVRNWIQDSGKTLRYVYITTLTAITGSASRVCEVSRGCRPRSC